MILFTNEFVWWGWEKNPEIYTKTRKNPPFGCPPMPPSIKLEADCFPGRKIRKQVGPALGGAQPANKGNVHLPRICMLIDTSHGNVLGRSIQVKWTNTHAVQALSHKRGKLSWLAFRRQLSYFWLLQVSAVLMLFYSVFILICSWTSINSNENYLFVLWITFLIYFSFYLR